MNSEIILAPATGAEVLYRIVSVDQPTAEDFRGHRDPPRRRPVTPDTPWVLLAGVSMFDTPAQALRIARRRPAGLARVRLRPEVGIHFVRTGRQGHHAVWGAPAVLLDCVEMTERAP